MKELLEKVAELRRLMEFYDVFQEDDEIGTMLQEIEVELGRVVKVVDKLLIS